jgi:hypothetical protein
MMRATTRRQAWFVTLAAATAGCGQRRAEWQVPAPLDVAAIMQRVMNTVDTNGDGLIDEGELSGLPALRGMIEPLAGSGDKRLSPAAISAWLLRVQQAGVAAHEAPMLITQRGRPLIDVLVKLVPEPCMAAATEPAEGRTDETGVVFLNTPTRQTPGVRPGLYRVQITGKGADGKPLPAKYNSASILGYAVGGGLPTTRTPIYELH